MDALLVTKDLMFSSRVKGIARDLEIDLAIRGRADSVGETLEGGGLKVLIIDLETPNCPLEEWIETAASNTASTKTKIVAYAPHGQVDRIKTARAAGCDAVLTRGQFDSNAATILQESCQG